MPALSRLPMSLSNPRKRVITVRDTINNINALQNTALQLPEELARHSLERARSISIDRTRYRNRSIQGVSDTTLRHSLENPSQACKQRTKAIALINSLPVINSSSTTMTKKKDKRFSFCSKKKSTNEVDVQGVDAHNESCPICLDPLTGRAWVFTACNHRFHRECLATWLVKGSSMLCPTCRVPVKSPKSSKQTVVG